MICWMYFRVASISTQTKYDFLQCDNILQCASLRVFIISFCGRIQNTWLHLAHRKRNILRMFTYVCWAPWVLHANFAIGRTCSSDLNLANRIFKSWFHLWLCIFSCEQINAIRSGGILLRLCARVKLIFFICRRSTYSYKLVIKDAIFLSVRAKNIGCLCDCTFYTP